MGQRLIIFKVLVTQKAMQFRFHLHCDYTIIYIKVAQMIEI